MEILEYRSKIDYLANTYIIKFDNEAIIIDPSDDSKEFEDYIKNLNITNIYLTHGHFDHIMGIKLFINKDINIYISSEDEELLYDSKLNESLSFLGYDFYFKDKINIKYLNNNDEFYFGNHVIKVIKNPYHTNGSCSLFLDNKYLFCGDAIFSNGYGRIDLNASRPDKFKENFKKLMNIINEFHPTIFPGHGEIFKK